MPFHEKLNSVYNKIKIICNDYDINCQRSDEIAIGSITKGLIQEIYNSDIIIADLTFSNPNVFYELAISHCIGRKTIMITQEDKIPFDIGQEYVINYSNSFEGSLILEKEVKRLLEHLLNGGIIDNPAFMFLPNNKDKCKTISTINAESEQKYRDSLAALEMKLSKQGENIKQILNHITAPINSNSSNINELNHKINFNFFEGSWVSITSKSKFFGLIENGNLFIPYCYGDSNHLTGHYYNCRILGNTLFTRYKWFHRPISGYAFYNVVSKNKLVGGWWYSRDVSNAIQCDDITRINDSIPGMTDIILKRDTTSNQKLSWVDEYLRNKLQY